MKFDKNNPKHWLYLFAGAAAIILTLPFRPLRKLRKKPIVALYGHKLNGNLKAFYDYVENQGSNSPVEIIYLTMDPEYYRVQKSAGTRVALAHNLFHMFRVGQADVMITDHGYHSIYIYYRFTSMKFVDVWHGVPFKGYSTRNFEAYQNYASIWVSSKTLQNIYVNKFHFDRDKVTVTGYARVDNLVNKSYDKTSILKSYGIKSSYDGIVLMAPTWKQDDRGRSIIPFDMDMKEFFRGLNQLGEKLNTLIIFRAHLNSGEMRGVKSFSYVKIMPYSQYPVGEDFLAIADVLVSDWSSIVFDYLVLRRPTIFMDVPAPFKDGFTIDRKYRFGDVVKSHKDLLKAIEVNIKHPDSFRRKYGKLMNETDRIIYGGMADGGAARRYQKELLKLINA